MNRVVAFFVVAFISGIIFSCASPKPYYKTAEGRKKTKYYNDIQFGRDPHPKKKF